MKLLIASNNAHKVIEIKQILGNYFDSIYTLREAGIKIDVVEDGQTFEENAVKKAVETLAAAEGFDAALADDSGLCVDALNGAPGIYSARFAGEGHNDDENNEKLMEVMKDVPDSERGCHYACAMALAYRDGTVITAEGQVDGTLLHGPVGQNGFGYDPYFYYEPFHCSFAELSAEQKNSVSHRKNALEALRAKLTR